MAPACRIPDLSAEALGLHLYSIPHTTAGLIWESPMARGARCARLPVLIAAALSVVSCGSEPMEPRRVPAAIVILPNAPSLPQKSTKQLVATVVDAGGRESADETEAYESTDTTARTVSARGLSLPGG